MSTISTNGRSPRTEVVRASEMQEKVVRRIFELKNPDAISEHREQLAKYKRRLGKRKEVTVNLKGNIFSTRKARGFVVQVYDEEVFVERPTEKNPCAYGRMGYDRSWGFTTYAKDYGLLADAVYNRDMRADRVDKYVGEMKAGRWLDLLSDPISITEAGDVVNGQHRIAAVTQVDWSKAANDPVFLVVWGVDPREARHADGSRRTPRDEKTIATKLLDEEFPAEAAA